MIGVDYYKLVVDDDVKTILPNKNRLVIMNHSLRMGHWVTPTNIGQKKIDIPLWVFVLIKIKICQTLGQKRKDQRIDK